MKIAWLLDADLFEHYREELVSAIRDQGHEVKLVQAPSPPYRWEDVGCGYRGAFAEGACVVAHGDIELVTRIGEEGRWTPGVFGTVENFFCSSYACRYGRWMLNRDYVMLPFGELERRRDFLFEAVGRDGRVFVRPDSPLKLFTGQVATRETFEADLEFMGFYEFPERELVVVSPPEEILAEWRFVVADGRVVTGCEYKSGDEFESRAGYDEKAFALAEEIAGEEYQPDPAWVMDICKTADGSYHLLEVGGFSFADLYACEMGKVVEAVSAAAGRVWREGSG